MCVIVVEIESNTEDNQVSRSAKTGFAPVVLIALGAFVAVVVMRTAHRAESTVMLSNGQKLFTLNDFDSGRVSYPSQNLANGQGQITPPALGGADHSHVFWSNGTFTRACVFHQAEGTMLRFSPVCWRAKQRGASLHAWCTVLYAGTC